METINDYNRYTQLMRKGFYDKLFFIDKIFDPWESLLDFGCADGFQTKMLAGIFPEKRIVGYDSDEDMINRALFTGSYLGNVRFTSNPEECSSGDVIYLSSLVHEIYSYNRTEAVEAFWKNVFSDTRKFVIIRDMGYSYNDNTYKSQKNHDIADITKTWCKRNLMLGDLQRFEEHFGGINTGYLKPLLHFLLKYPYINSPNWMREVHEDYLPIAIETLIKKAPEGWAVDYKEQYTLPFLKYKWRKELGIDVDFKTHVKLIFRNTNQNL